MWTLPGGGSALDRVSLGLDPIELFCESATGATLDAKRLVALI